MGSKEEVEKLKELCAPVVEYLKQKGNPYYEVVVSQEHIKLSVAEIGIPIKEISD